MYSFDLETTGVDPEEDRAVSATLMTIEFDGGTAKVSVRDWLIDPGVPIPEAAAAVHGITTERAQAEGRPAPVAIPEIVAALNECMSPEFATVIYNAPFDLTMLHREGLRYGAELKSPVGIYDPLVVDKELNRFVSGKGQRQLVNACKRNGIILSEEDAHTSSGDTLAAARLAWKQAGDGRLTRKTLVELFDLQQRWYRAQSLNFAKYLETKGGDPVGAERVRSEADGWPIRPVPEPVPQAEIPF